MYTLHPISRLLSQGVILTVSNNKKQLVELIVHDLMSHNDTLDSRIIIIGGSPIPIDICAGNINRRVDMAVTHEEADTIIIR